MTSRFLLLTVSVASLNAALLASASAATCVTSESPTFAPVINEIGGGTTGARVVTGITPTFGSVTTTPGSFLSSTGISQTPGTAVTGVSVTAPPGNGVASVTAPTTNITGITPGSNNPNLATVAVNQSIPNNAPPAARFAFNP